MGLGCSLSESKNGGPWTPKEAEFHINYLELLAAFLAIQAFIRDKTDLTVYIQMDSVIALTHINKRGRLSFSISDASQNPTG